MSLPEYPRLLAVMLNRVNAADGFNTGLFMRNLLAAWPKDRLAQIFSGRENGDAGFFGRYYRLSQRDRRFGSLFFRLKNRHAAELLNRPVHVANRAGGVPSGNGPVRRLRRILGRFVLETGIYEQVFRPELSEDLLRWVADFRPDIIFSDGYSLTFSRLSQMLKERFHVPLCYYTQDDWPSFLHSPARGVGRVVGRWMRRVVEGEGHRLVHASQVRFSFNPPMNAAYEARYGVPFTPLMLCDDPRRFSAAPKKRRYPADTYWIVAAGGFYEARWELLLDLEAACERLAARGMRVRATVLATLVAKSGIEALSRCRHLELLDSPSHEELPGYLKAADALYLPETFDPSTAYGWRHSVSSKAHLFMFSRRPIIVYGHPDTGLVRYAKDAGWAFVLDRRDVPMLADALERVARDVAFRDALVARADLVAARNHDCHSVRELFRSRLVEAVHVDGTRPAPRGAGRALRFTSLRKRESVGNRT